MSAIISNYIAAALCLAQDDRDKLMYSLQVILGEASKLILLYLFFLCFARQGDFIKAAISLCIIRIYTGGLHFKTYAGCLFFSLLFFSAAIFLAESVVLTQVYMFALSFIALTIIALIAPVTSKNRPDYSERQRFNFKVIGCSVAYLHLVGSVAIKNSPYFTIAMWVIFLQAIQLLIAKGVENHEKKIQV